MGPPPTYKACRAQPGYATAQLAPRRRRRTARRAGTGRNGRRRLIKFGRLIPVLRDCQCPSSVQSSTPVSRKPPHSPPPWPPSSSSSPAAPSSSRATSRPASVRASGRSPSPLFPSHHANIPSSGTLVRGFDHVVATGSKMLKLAKVSALVRRTRDHPGHHMSPSHRCSRSRFYSQSRIPEVRVVRACAERYHGLINELGAGFSSPSSRKHSARAQYGPAREFASRDVREDCVLHGDSPCDSAS